jgi:hypothetical protein
MKVLIICHFLLIALTGFKHVDRPVVYSGENVAIAELFTSEGCSSCPAADEMLNEMTGILAKENKTVVGLAFHITYWDHLGWKDPYSQPEFTERQKKYCSFLQVPSIYTPQMIVNGEFEFVGSDPISFRNTVEKVLTTSAPYTLSARANVEGGEVKIIYSLNKKPRNEMLNIAIIETSVENNVKHGENKNRTLKHYNIVRKLETIDPLAQGELTVTMPASLDPGKCAVVLFMQHKRNLKILGAIKINLRSTSQP